VAAELALGHRQTGALAPLSTLGIADSTYNERELAEAGFTATSVAPVLVDLEEFDRDVDERERARLEAAKAAGGVDLLFVGRLAPNKAQHDLIKALAVYRRAYDPAARLHLVGGSSSAVYAAALESYAAALGLEEAVELTGSVSPGVLAAHYRAADAFVCLSEHEGFCVPLLEAMHHRVPIVAFAAAAVPETLGGAGLLLPSKSPSTVASAVHRVLDDALLRRALVTAGTQRLEDFRLDRARARFASLIEGLMGR
jgi:glycosyltransferase involved in cell wall biosynthesis